jgi:hypothetical protein
MRWMMAIQLAAAAVSAGASTYTSSSSDSSTSHLLDIAVNTKDGSFEISMGGDHWLSSASPRYFVNGGWANLTLVSTAPAPAVPGFAAGTAWRWAVASDTNTAAAAVWQTAIRKTADGGSDAALFTQTFLQELGHSGGHIAPPCPNITRGNTASGCTAPPSAGSRVAPSEVAIAEFPVVEVPENGPALGVFCGAGMSDGPRLSVFNDANYDPAGTANMPGNWGGSAGGPTALFDASPEHKTLVISPAGPEILSTVSPVR